jgi:hypothetical protein
VMLSVLLELYLTCDQYWYHWTIVNFALFKEAGYTSLLYIESG